MRLRKIRQANANRRDRCTFGFGRRCSHRRSAENDTPRICGGGGTQVGHVRERNEDIILVEPELWLFRGTRRDGRPPRLGRRRALGGRRDRSLRPAADPHPATLVSRAPRLRAPYRVGSVFRAGERRWQYRGMGATVVACLRPCSARSRWTPRGRPSGVTRTRESNRVALNLAPRPLGSQSRRGQVRTGRRRVARPRWATSSRRWRTARASSTVHLRQRGSRCRPYHTRASASTRLSGTTSPSVKPCRALHAAASSGVRNACTVAHQCTTLSHALRTGIGKWTNAAGEIAVAPSTENTAGSASPP